ncbi:MAG: acyltransferase [Lachnospiraceae bacterium]|nr:acyltransferase [Lachnospiraceae bacterium]
MEKRYNSEIGILRFVFASLIFLVHAFQVFHLPVFGDANYAVEFFFFLSGFYLAAHVIGKKKDGEDGGEACRNYLSARFGKVFPILLAAILYGLLADVIISAGTFDKKSLLYIFNEIVPLQGYGLPATTLTGVTWYLSVMFIGMALLYPVLYRWGSWFVKVYSVVIALILYGILAVVVGNLSAPGELVFFFLRGTVRGLGAMCIGCFIYGSMDRVERVPLLKSASVRLAVRVLCYALVITGMAFLNDSPYLFSLLPPYVAAVTLSLYRKDGEGRTRPGVERFARMLQEASLPMYLFHSRTVRLVEWASGSFLKALHDSPWGKTAVAFILSVAISILWLILERSVKKALRKKSA